MKKTIWTKCYTPFIMGGNVNAPISTEAEVSEPFDLGGGFEGHLVVSPDGMTHVVESETGALVGASIGQVKSDIDDGDPDVMRKQIQDAKLEFAKSIPLTNEEFWKKFW